MYLAFFMLYFFYVFMCRIVTVSLSSLDLFISVIPLQPPLFLPIMSVTITVHMVILSLTCWLSFFSIHLLPLLFILSFPLDASRCVIFCLFLRVSCIHSLNHHSYQIKITSLKIQSTLPPQTPRVLLVGYSCIQVYIVSWWWCIWNTEQPNMVDPSKFDLFIHSQLSVCLPITGMFIRPCSWLCKPCSAPQWNMRLQNTFDCHLTISFLTNSHFISV